MVKIEGTLDEIRELLGNAKRSSGASPGQSQGMAKTPQKSKRKLSGWQRYIANSRNHIKIKSGPRKGRLDLAKMAKKFRSGQKKRK